MRCLIHTDVFFSEFILCIVKMIDQSAKSHYDIIIFYNSAADKQLWHKSINFKSDT